MNLIMTIHPEELNTLIEEVLTKVVSKIKAEPEKYFPTKPFELKLYSIQDIADLLRVSTSTVRILCRDGHLKFIRPSGRNYMISQEHLDQYLAQQIIDNNE